MAGGDTMTEQKVSMPIRELKIALAAITLREMETFLVIETDHALRGTDLEVTVSPERVPEAGRILNEACFTLEAITGIDWLEQGRMEVVYDYTRFDSGLRVTVRAFTGREEPVLPTLSAIYPGADWHEREAHDFFGILFTGHPDMTPLLLPEDADFYPLRKDFTG
jgi:NADH-quinone oxidoreductase subunit C